MQPENQRSIAGSEDKPQCVEHKSYVGSALAVSFLYLLFWLPGLVANIIYLSAAREDEGRTGRAPKGVGCLWLLLILNIIVISSSFFVVIAIVSGLLEQ